MRLKFVSFLFFLLPVKLLAASLGNGAVDVALANSAVGSVQPSDSILSNPSTMAHLSGIWLGVGSKQSKIKNFKITENHISLSENSIDSLIPSGIYLEERLYSSMGRYYDQDITLSIGNFLMPQLALGASYTNRKTVFGEDTWTEGSPSIGALWTPNDALGLGIVFKNINYPAKDVPINSRLTQSYQVGVTYLFSNFIRFRFDTDRNSTLATTSTSGGFESLINEWFILRAGYGKEMPSGDEKYSFGMSFLGPKFHIHYGYQSLRTGPETVLQAVDFNIPF